MSLSKEKVKCYWCKESDAYLIKPGLHPICTECFFEGIGSWIGEGKTLVVVGKVKKNE